MIEINVNEYTLRISDANTPAHAVLVLSMATEFIQRDGIEKGFAELALAMRREMKIEFCRRSDLDITKLMDGGKRCPKCGGQMAHYRLGGWRCLKGCQQ